VKDLSNVKVEFTDGSEYTGKLVRHGFGVFKAANGDVYEGNWELDKKAAEAKQVEEDMEEHKDKDNIFEAKFNSEGGNYTGNYQAGQFNGFGKFTYKDGSYYEGTWKKGKMDGMGTFFLKEGSVYIGEWKQNMRHGKGVFKDHENNIMDGLWKFNKFDQSGE